MCAVTGYLLTFRPTPVYTYPSQTVTPTPEPPLVITEGMVNLNTATFEELLTLPGIGEVTARAILDLRANLGAFRIKEDLLIVKGIGEKKLDAILELIYIK